MVNSKPAKIRLDVRVKNALKSADAETRKVFSGLLSQVGELEVRGVVRALRVFGRAKLRPSQRKALRDLLKVALTETMQRMRVRPDSLGLNNLDELADLFLAMVERTRYARFGSTALRTTRNRKGLRSNFAGELFERLVLHDRGLGSYIEDLGDSHRKGLNNAIKKAPHLLVNGKDQPITVLQAFKGNGLATDLALVVEGVPVPLKFVDIARVAFSGSGSKRRIAILVEIEAKIRGRRGEFNEQIDAARPRLKEAISLELVVDGKKVTFRSEDVVFHTGLDSRVAVTSTRLPNGRASFQQSRNNAYLRVGLAVDASELHRLSGILFNVCDRFVDLR